MILNWKNNFGNDSNYVDSNEEKKYILQFWLYFGHCIPETCEFQKVKGNVKTLSYRNFGYRQVRKKE